MKISILIPAKGDNEYLRECIAHCLELDYPDFEILVLLDGKSAFPHGKKVRVLPTGVVGPAQKRDMARSEASGEILAFLDDDVLPEKDWLKNAVEGFKDPDVAAVCGPAVTPASGTLRQQASGLVYSSLIVSGPHRRRYIPTRRCEVDDYPSCNFLIRKDIFQKIGGFDTKFWPGEDTILCLKITKELNKKIIYDPRVVVCHHRRPVFSSHLKQIKSYALHRGYFVKKFPKTSLRLAYFIPSLFVLGLLFGGVISFFMPKMNLLYFGAIVTYLMAVVLSSLRGGRRPTKQSQNRDCFAPAGLAMTIKLHILVFFGIILTHLTYGIYFIAGLFNKRLSEE